MFNSRRRGGVIKETGTAVNSRVRLQWNFTAGKPLTAPYASDLSRALLKVGLECAWIDHGEMMLEPRFDHIRHAVLGEPRAGHFTFGNRGDPNFTSGTLVYHLLPYEDDTWRMVVAACFYGVMIVTDFRLPEPPGDIPEGLLTTVTFDGSKRRAAWENGDRQETSRADFLG